MFESVFTAVVLLLAALALTLCLWIRGVLAEEVALLRMPPHWTTNYAAALKEHEENDVPLLMYFSSGSCSWCQRMERYVWPEPKVLEVAKGYIKCYQVRERHKAVFRRFKVQGVPMTLVIEDGKIVKKRVGYMNVNDMMGFLR